MKKVKAKLKLLKHQIEFLRVSNLVTSIYTILTAGFGSGKTDAGFFWLLNQMQKYGKLKTAIDPYVVGMYEPNYSMLDLLIFPRITSFLDGFNIKHTLNISKKTLWIPSFNTKVIFKSMEKPGVIVGYEHHDFWIDELDTLTKKKAKFAFTKILERNRLSIAGSDHENKGIITTTPENLKFCYEAWEKDIKPGYARVKGKTKNNIFLKKSFITNLESQHPKELLDQVLDGEFVNMNQNQVYYTFKRKTHNTKVTFNNFFSSSEKKIIHIGMDFNLDKMSAVICVINEEDKEVYAIDEIFGVKDTVAMIKAIKKKYDSLADVVYIYPDPAGKNRSNADASVSNHILLKHPSTGFKLRAMRAHPLVRDRVMSVNGMFLNSLDMKRLFVNVNMCPVLTENLEQQVYDKNGKPEKDADNDHMLDALGYLIYKLYPIKRQLFFDKE